MTFLQALLIAILQGVTELFPVSSLGHAVVLPKLVGWDNVNQKDPHFLPFLVVLHLGTATALLLYFWRDWIDLFLTFIGRGAPERKAANWRTIILIVVATIPAVVIAVPLAEFIRKQLFSSPTVAAAFLIVNGFVLFFGERLRRKSAGTRKIADMNWVDAVKIGLWQSLALIPGISRSGTTMVGGLLAGLHHKESAHFSFLIATPIIWGATVHEAPRLLHQDGGMGLTPLVWVSGIVAGVTAYISIAFLMRYFRKHDFEALNPFAYYCWGFGAISLGLLLFVF